MDYIQLKFNSRDGKTGYRALPAQIMHPRLAWQFTQQEFDSFTNQKMASTLSLTRGHAGTTLWYTGTASAHFYILQIKFERSLFGKQPDQFYRSLCTHTPDFGVDMVDGWFCEDIEEYALLQTLKRPSRRLSIFGNNDSVPLWEYLQSRGFPHANA